MSATAEKPDKAGFEIEGRFFPFPDGFRLGDPVLVTELTGLDFNDFVARLDDEEERSDPVVLIGLIGVAVWQANPRWRRDRVLRYVQNVDIDKFEAVGGEDESDEKEKPGDPPAEPPTAASNSDD